MTERKVTCSKIMSIGAQHIFQDRLSDLALNLAKSLTNHLKDIFNKFYENLIRMQYFSTWSDTSYFTTDAAMDC